MTAQVRVLMLLPLLPLLLLLLLLMMMMHDGAKDTAAAHRQHGSADLL